ncbi:hypothetical protein GW17_00034773 [Ensete ventricosum]|nr:hypothetical protein GW17_00034773 [Ensete ventricosum]
MEGLTGQEILGWKVQDPSKFYTAIRRNRDLGQVHRLPVGPKKKKKRPNRRRQRRKPTGKEIISKRGEGDGGGRRRSSGDGRYRVIILSPTTL